ncbi:hypothetical protein Lfu02_60720 [Longispora fulva]|uniref:N-acetyltransferase domain-containing protein n=1 Tax=Longispora fulva TaxID=619741 RepID=A0A8J7KQ26_9ACTN|nr:GNAT family N-acetyltransferase [Longispora fulva]MBG6136947.1 hypothetical protein [Longispora fulva]GIG61700.1 hypothetical protein Lfu02_60720 [Longispora fulva]
MTWSTTSDIGVFLAAARAFLESRPVEHTVLLTEAAYLHARPSAATDQLHGWWRTAGGDVAGAFVRAPRHPPVLSMVPADGMADLADVLAGARGIGVDGRLADSVAVAWERRTGVRLTERSRITLYRLERLEPPAPPRGSARTAGPADRDLLVSWFERMMAAFPDDPSDLAYVVDDPISVGGITLWEVDGVPVAMAGRSRTVAGMVRLSAVYAPDDETHADAAFVAACATAAETARDVLVFGSADDGVADGKYRALGFRPVLDRVTLG